MKTNARETYAKLKAAEETELGEFWLVQGELGLAQAHVRCADVWIAEHQRVRDEPDASGMPPRKLAVPPPQT